MWLALSEKVTKTRVIVQLFTFILNIQNDSFLNICGRVCVFFFFSYRVLLFYGMDGRVSSSNLKDSQKLDFLKILIW